MSSNQNNINPKSCIYGCGLQIYWNSDYNQYWEVFSQKKHICPNRQQQQSKPTTTTTTAAATKPTYYNKKPWNAQPKPKMSNSFELLTGPTVAEIQKKYEILSDIVIVEHGGKVHGSQSHIIANNSMQLIVYYEVPLGMRDEVKRKYSIQIRNHDILQHRM